jgi:hypothetical protein
LKRLNRLLNALALLCGIGKSRECLVPIFRTAANGSSFVGTAKRLAGWDRPIETQRIVVA